MANPLPPMTPEQYRQWEAVQMAQGNMLTHEQVRQRELARQQAMQQQQVQAPSLWQQARNFSLLDQLRSWGQGFMGRQREDYQDSFDRRNDPDRYQR